ncbi:MULTISPECIES: phage baseplate assembly protein V [unclassified Nocardioides]|uniref:phage baseplate assembly protein V n=1 Tax=unclassified Nocardioides TaxID=2615069 RepID=UPI0019101DFD|nr:MULTISPECIES: phage baseplate assembly protein V [unclassified Nocardioides]
MTTEMIDLLGPANQARDARWFGMYTAVVTDVQDPDGQGRVKVRLAWSPDTGGSRYEAWARLATTMAGNSRGTWFVPEPEDEVLVGFGGGNPNHPYVVGALWNGQDATPQSMDSDNNIRAIVSREDIRITMDDTQGAVKLTLSTPGGRTVTLDDAGMKVTVDDGNGNTLEMASAGITVTASAKVTVNASTVKVSAGMVTVDAGMSKFSGVVQCDTLITNSVVSSSYTPGAGNVW